MDIETRIQGIERSLRQWRVMAISLALVFVVALAVAMVAPQQGIKGIRLFDIAGTYRGCFDLSDGPDENPIQWFHDKEGKKRLFVGLDTNGEPLIQFFNATEQPVFYLNIAGMAAGAPNQKGVFVMPANGNMTVSVNWKQKGETFHKKFGPGVPRCKDLTQQFPRDLTVREAEKMEMEPCPICFPECWKGSP